MAWIRQQSLPLFSLRLLLLATSYCFVVQPFWLFSFLQWFPSNEFFYFLFFLLGVATLITTWVRHHEMRATVISLFVTFLPVVLFIVLGTLIAREFHYLILLSVGLYFISLFGFLAYTFSRRHLEDSQSSGRLPLKIWAPFAWRVHENRLAIGMVLVLTLVFFGFGFQNLTRFAAVDEPLWLDGRIGKFWKHLSNEHMDKTLISDKPGITIALASGPGLWFVQPKDYRSTRNGFEAAHPGINIEEYYRAFRLPLLIVITLCLPLFYLLLVPLIGTGAALFGYSAVTLSPVLIGMSKIVNPDSLLWIFAPLSFLAYLVFLEKRAWRFLYLSGVFFGLALLTKYVANFLAVYVFALSILYPLLKKDEQLSLSFLFKAFLIWSGIGLSVLYLLVPAFWVEPRLLLLSTILSQAFEKVAWIFLTLIVLVFIDQLVAKSRVSNFLINTLKPYSASIQKMILGAFIIGFTATFLNGILGMPRIDFSMMLASPKTSEVNGIVAVFFSNFYPLIFGVVPLVLLGVSSMFWKTWRGSFQTSPLLARFTVSITLFILLYYLGSTVNGVVLINRYQIMLYPLLAILGGTGLYFLIKTLFTRFNQSDFSLRLPISLVFFIGTIVILAWSPLTTPFPLSYASSLLPKPYSVDVKDMGAGSYEAAMYLNGLPNARVTAIWTDKGGVCKFYLGPCLDGFNKRNLKDYDVRYIVVSSGRESRTSNRFTPNDPGHNPDDETLIRLDSYYHRNDPLHEILINGRTSQSVKIFTLNP